MISCRWKFLLFLSKKIFSMMSLDQILKINFFFILFDWILGFLKNVYREGIKISKKISWSCWANLLKIFSSSLLRRIFQKWPSPPSNVGNNFFEKMKFFFKKNRSSFRDIEKNVFFSKHEQHKWPKKLSVPGMNFFDMSRPIRVKDRQKLKTFDKISRTKY